jgi:hypothetical protein
VAEKAITNLQKWLSAVENFLELENNSGALI